MRPRTRSSLLLALSLCAATTRAQQGPVAPPPAQPPAPAPPAAASPDDALRARYTATFRHNGPNDQAALEAAVHTAVAGMGFLIEGIAASRLRERQSIPDTLAFAFPPGFTEVRAAGRPPMRAPADGATVSTTNHQGEPIQLHIHFEHGTLVLAADTPQGGRRTEYLLSSDGLSLMVRTTVHSPRLPRPLVFVLNYRRA